MLWEIKVLVLEHQICSGGALRILGSLECSGASNLFKGTPFLLKALQRSGSGAPIQPFLGYSICSGSVAIVLGEVICRQSSDFACVCVES